jgi:hypothetical protein
MTTEICRGRPCPLHNNFLCYSMDIMDDRILLKEDLNGLLKLKWIELEKCDRVQSYNERIQPANVVDGCQ